MNDDLEQHSAAAGATEGACLGVSPQTRLPPLKRFWVRSKNWASQRSTLMGVVLITFGLAGVEWQFLPEKAIGTLFGFGAFCLIPEDWVIMRQAVSIFAPVLAHQLVQHRLASMAAQTPKPSLKQPEGPLGKSSSSPF